MYIYTSNIPSTPTSCLIGVRALRTKRSAGAMYSTSAPTWPSSARNTTSARGMRAQGTGCSPSARNKHSGTAAPLCQNSGDMVMCMRCRIVSAIAGSAFAQSVAHSTPVEGSCLAKASAISGKAF